MVFRVLPHLRDEWRKHLLVVAGGAAFIYSIYILVYVSSTPDIGIQCAFSTPVIKHVDARYLPQQRDLFLLGQKRVQDELALSATQAAKLTELMADQKERLAQWHGANPDEVRTKRESLPPGRTSGGG